MKRATRNIISFLVVVCVLLWTPWRLEAAEIKRYFSTTGAGAADGTTWADRAELDPAGAWSTVITGFAFNGTDSLRACIGPGTYTFSVSLATASFVNPPTSANPLLLTGCDGSGNALAIPDPDWVSAQAAFDDSTLPVLETTTNISTVNLANTFLLLLKFTASGRNGSVVLLPSGVDWTVISNSTANTAALAFTSDVTRGTVTNSVFSCSGSSYSAVLSVNNGTAVSNVRIVGNAGSSGNRDGVIFVGTTTRTVFNRLTVINNGGRGFAYTGTNVAVTVELQNFVLANNAGDQVLFPNTAAQTNFSTITGGMITGGTAFGVNPGGANTSIIITQTRLRDNASGNFGTTGNYPINLNIYTTDSDDATEYVNTAGGDYRIKNTAAIWGLGFGAGDEPAVGGFKNFLGGQ